MQSTIVGDNSVVVGGGVDVVVVVVLQKIQIIKDGGETGHRTCRCCLKTT